MLRILDADDTLSNYHVAIAFCHYIAIPDFYIVGDKRKTIGCHAAPSERQ
jgi:hypothetical protein